MEPFKIAHLITGLSRAGAETVLVRLVLHMDPKRFTPVVISLTDDHGYGADLRVAGVPLYTLGMKRGRPSLGALLRPLGIDTVAATTTRTRGPSNLPSRLAMTSSTKNFVDPGRTSPATRLMAI